MRTCLGSINFATVFWKVILQTGRSSSCVGFSSIGGGSDGRRLGQINGNHSLPARSSEANRQFLILGTVHSCLHGAAALTAVYACLETLPADGCSKMQPGDTMCKTGLGNTQPHSYILTFFSTLDLLDSVGYTAPFHSLEHHTPRAQATAAMALGY